MISMMKSSVAALVVLSSVGLAAAQAVIELTPDQRTTVFRTITKERVVTAPPADLQVSVGAVLPSTVEVYEVPATVEVVPVRRFRYTIVNNQVVLVDPGTRRVIEIIRD